MLTILTPTGMRQEAFSLCEKWMLRQSYNGPARWVIIDDGPDETSVGEIKQHWERVVVRPEPRWCEGQNTQRRNLDAGLAVVDDADSVLIIEDDDHYSQDWLTAAEAHLENHCIVGESFARYYDVRNCIAKQFYNREHASLCSTALRGAALDRLRALITQDIRYIDIALWQFDCDKHLFFGAHVVGIKGLPGRTGIGSGHDGLLAGEADASRDIFRRWLGADAEAYRPFHKQLV